MALTAAEEAELRQLEADQRDHEDEKVGGAHVTRMDDTRFRPASSTSSFSSIRAVFGALRDAGQSVLDFSEDVADHLERVAPLPVVRFGKNAKNGIADVVTGQEAIDFTDSTRQLPSLPGIKGEEHAGTAEKIVRGFGSFMVPFIGWSKVFGVTKAAGWLGRAGRAMLAGAATDAMQDPSVSNLANTIKDTFGVDNDFLDSLTTDEDDDSLYRRFKAAAVNAPVGIAADALLEGGFRALKAYRDWRGSIDEAKVIVDNVMKDTPARVPVVYDEEFAKSQRARMGAEETAEAGAKGAEGAKRANKADAFAPEKEAPENWNDVLDFLKDKAGLGQMDEELFARFAAKLVSGQPEHALAKLGIDPLKLDWSELDDPDMLARLQKGLAEVYEGIAHRLGRSNERVTEEAMTGAARSLATTADVLKDLYERTGNLAEVFLGSRVVVGGHAHKLLSQAEQLIDNLVKGAPEAQQQWLDFLASFERHAYYLGALRGAGSEVARALRSLQIVTKLGKSGAKREFAEAVKESGAKASPPKEAQRLALEAVAGPAGIDNDADKILFLRKLLEHDGDVGEVSRYVRANAGSPLKRIDGILSETRGNLFASTTAIGNALSAAALMGMNGLAKALVAVGRAALSPFGREMAARARVAEMEAWAYVDGSVGAWRDAFRNTMALLEREGMEEVSLNLKALGLKGLAKKAAAKSVEGARDIKQNYERVDVSSHARDFALTDADIRAVQEIAAGYDLPKLMQHSIRWTLKALAPIANAAGTLTRAGTILLVNAPDQFMGTIAARAGAQAQAVRLAAIDAAEHGLEGAELSTFLKARMIQLADTVDGHFTENLDDAYSAGQQQVVRAYGVQEAKAALFQDRLEVLGALDTLGHKPFVHLIIPFVRTPLRILERTLIDYTPLGLLKDRIRADIAAGGARRDEALARIGLGTMAVITAMMLSEDREIVGSDGTYTSTARLTRDSYTLRIGGDEIAFNRIDPIGTLLGWGADFRAHLDHEGDNPNAGSQFEQMVEAAMVATSANILAKSWFTSLRNLVDLSKGIDEGQSADAWGRFIASYAGRFTPGGGMQRSLEQGVDGNVREADGFIEGMLKQSLGASKLPVKRDHILGRPVTVGTGERAVGFKGDPTTNPADDPLGVELERLSFDVPRPSRSIKGVRMNSTEFSRWLELRGQVVKKPSTGLTMEETLSKLIELPAYKQLGRDGKVAAMRDEMLGFSKLATQQLLREDHEFARKVLASEVWAAERVKGTSREAADAQTAKLAHDLGLDK